MPWVRTRETVLLIGTAMGIAVSGLAQAEPGALDEPRIILAQQQQQQNDAEEEKKKKKPPERQKDQGGSPGGQERRGGQEQERRGQGGGEGNNQRQLKRENSQGGQQQEQQERRQKVQQNDGGGNQQQLQREERNKALRDKVEEQQRSRAKQENDGQGPQRRTLQGGGQQGQGQEGQGQGQGNQRKQTGDQDDRRQKGLQQGEGEQQQQGSERERRRALREKEEQERRLRAGQQNDGEGSGKRNRQEDGDGQQGQGTRQGQGQDGQAERRTGGGQGPGGSGQDQGGSEGNPRETLSREELRERSKDRREFSREKLKDITGQRRERREEGGRTVIEEPGNRRIESKNGRAIIRSNETDRFRGGARDFRVEKGEGGRNRTIITRPNGVQIISIQDENGRLIRRIKRTPNGRERILINNEFRRDGRRFRDRDRDDDRGGFGFYIELPEPVINISQEEYYVDAEGASEDEIEEALSAPPVDDVEGDYSLDEIRYSDGLRKRLRKVSLSSINFEFGSWDIREEQVVNLREVAEALKRILGRNPDEVFLIAGFTDAVGSDTDNLSLSDRRAESVARVLTDEFGVPPENLVTQGYGEQDPLVLTQEPEIRNRRVEFSRITPFLAQKEESAGD